MQPRDFLSDDNEMQNTMGNESMGRDFLQDFSEEQPKESYGWSMAYAVPRAVTDLSKRIYNFAQSVPKHLRAAKTEVPGLLNPVGQMWQNPKHALRQGLAGSLEALNSLAQFPVDVARYGADRLNLLPQSVPNALQKILPQDASQGINELFGGPQYPGEALLRGTARNIVPIAGVTKLLQAAPHLTKFGASRKLKKADKLAKNRDIGTLNVNPELIEDARQFLPNTLPHRNALADALSGDYNTLFKLQSDVGKNAGDYAKSFFSSAERSHGRAGLEARNRLLDAIHENLQIQGHNDISKLLREGQRDYRRYMNFKPYRNTLGLAGLGMLIPKNSLTNIASKILSRKTQ